MNKPICREIQEVKVYMTSNTTATTAVNPAMPLGSYIRVLRRNGKAYSCIKM
jgi:hypothetical protein